MCCLHGVCLVAPAMHTPSLPALLAPPCTALRTAASLSLRLSRFPLHSPSAPSSSSSLPPLPHFLPLQPAARCLPPHHCLSPLPLPLPPSPHTLCPVAAPLLVPTVISPPVPATLLSASNAPPSTPADSVCFHPLPLCPHCCPLLSLLPLPPMLSVLQPPRCLLLPSPCHLSPLPCCLPLLPMSTSATHVDLRHPHLPSPPTSAPIRIPPSPPSSPLSATAIISPPATIAPPPPLNPPSPPPL